MSASPPLPIGRRPSIRPPGTGRLGHSLSIYLDLLRFLAALAVFVSHVALTHISGGLLDVHFMVQLADDAVMWFFVLSGFVIAYTAGARDRSLPEYATARLSRLYSVVLPALLVTVVADAIGLRAAPEIYADWWPQAWSPVVRIGASALFVNELWYASIAPLSNGPFWSLGYEFWYYVLFGIAFYVRSPWRWPLGALACAIVGPKILLLFPIWIAGALAYHLRRWIPEALGWLLLVGSLAVYLGYRLSWFGDYLYWWQDGFVVQHFGINYSRHLPSKYLNGAVVTASLLGFSAVQHRFRLDAIERPVRWLAGMTFSLYLYHYPLLHVLAAVLPGRADSPLRATCVATLCIASCAALASVTERRKDVFRRGIEALGGGLARWGRGS